MSEDPNSLESRTRFIYEALLKGDRINLRAEERKPTYQPCEVRTTAGRRLKAIMKNISSGGAMLAGFDLASQHDDKLKLLSYSGAPRDVQIVWRHQELVGVRFI